MSTLNLPNHDSAVSPSPQFDVSVDGVNQDDWNGLISEFDDASIYQSWQYGAVHWSASQLSHLVLREHGRPVAAAQVRIVKLPILNRGVAYVRWGPLWRARNSSGRLSVFRAAIGALKDEYAVRRKLLLRIVPNIYDFDIQVGKLQEVLDETGYVLNNQERAYHTMHLDLTRSVDEIRKGLGQRWRNKLKHAEREGFEVSVGTGDDFYSKFMVAYREMMQRKRFPTTVDVHEFGCLQTALPDKLKMRVLVAEKDGVLFNALVVAPVGDTGIYLLAGTSDEGLKADGAFLLQWRAMNLLKELGCKWYDLGGVNPDVNPGVYQFKSGMGGSLTRQLGKWECSASSLSSVFVAGAEKLRRWISSVKHANKSGARAIQPVPSKLD